MTESYFKDLLVVPHPDFNRIFKRLLRFYDEPEAIEIRYCEVDEWLNAECVAIACETSNDQCFVAKLYGLFPNIKIIKKIKGEEAKLVRDKIKEISNLSGDIALNAFNALLHEVMNSNET